MTPEETRAYLQMLGFQDYGVPIGTDSNSQLNLFQDVMNTMSDPTFLYLQNLISGEQLATDAQDLLYDSIDPSEADWASMESTAEETGNDLLVQAMRDIRAGLTSNQVKTKLMKQFAVNNMVNDVDKNTIDNLIADLEDYEKKYKRAVEIDSKLLAGEYIQDEFGNILSPVDQETGRKRLEGAGFDGYYANPQNWQTAPNQEDVARSQKFLEEANAIEEERLNKSKAMTKSSATAAESAYKSFLSKTPEGRQVLEKISAPRQPKSRDMSVSEVAVKRNIPMAISYAGMKALKTLFKPSVKDAGQGFVRPWDKKPLAVQKREQEKAQTNQDYWAKLAASYAGRGEQEQKSKEVAALGKRVEQKKQAAQESMNAARTIQRGTTPALDMLAIAPYFAAMAAQSAPKASAGKPAMRTLSDQEIETMSNMIAGGLV